MTAYSLRLENGTDTAARVRIGDLIGLAPGASALTAESGLRPDGGGVVAIVNGTMTAEVDPFAAWIQGGISVVQGGYPFVLDAQATVTISDGHATLARVDTIVARVRDDSYDASGFTDAAVVVIAGTPGAGAPALPDNAVPLRDINVPAGASTGTGGLSAANLGTDRRVYLAGIDSPNEKAVNRFVANSMSYSSTSYAVLSNSTERTACSMSFTKRRDDTKLILDIRGNAWASSIVDPYTYGIVGLRVNGTDQDMARFSTYTIGVTADDAVLSFSGVKELAGVAAGTFTIEPVFKLTNTGTLFLDGASSLSFVVREVPA